MSTKHLTHTDHGNSIYIIQKDSHWFEYVSDQTLQIFWFRSQVPGYDSPVCAAWAVAALFTNSQPKYQPRWIHAILHILCISDCAPKLPV